jgi:phosphoribosyl-ATP pyrophosphohydrolase
MGKSTNKKKITLPIRTIVPKAKLKPKSKLKPLGRPKTKPKIKPKAHRRELTSPPPDKITDTVLDRLFEIVHSRRDANPTISHSARLLSRGTAKVAQKFGEEAVECLIEAVAGNREALIAESADVLYHLLVLWVSAGVNPADVWAELMHREGISGIAEKAARAKPMAAHLRAGTSKIP